MDLLPIPSAFTGEQRRYMEYLRSQLASIPVFSFFSGTTPESVVTGVAGNFAINPFSQSTNSLVFVKWGGNTASKVSWCVMSVRTVA